MIVLVHRFHFVMNRYTSEPINQIYSSDIVAPIMSSSRISETTQSSLGLQSYYSQQSVVPIGMQSQQQVVYGGGGGLSSSTSSSSTGFMSSPPQQPEMRPTDQQITSQGTVYPKRIFVGGIPAQTTEADLKLYFSQYGSVTETKIIQDRAGVSKGYGFVTFESADEVNKILAKDQQETLIFKDRKLNLGPAIRKNQLTQPGQPAPAQVIAYMPNSVPINSEGGQMIMLAPPMPMGDASYGPYQTAFPMLASGGQALYIQQPTYYMPQQQIAAGQTIQTIQIPANFQQQQHQQHQQHQQPQQHHIHHQTANSLTAQQHQTQLRATPQSPPTPGGHPMIPVACHYTPGGPSSTSVSDFYGADYEPIQSTSTDDNTSTWGSLSWGSQVATYPATSQVAPTGGLNLNRELDVAADPFTIPEAPSSTVQEIKQESSTIQNGATNSGSGYVSSTSSNVSLYNNGSGSNNNHSGESNQNEGFSGGYHKPASGGITGPDWSNF